jgi:taurine dioxygenase
MYRHAAGPKRLERLAPGAPAPVFSRIEVEPVGATLGALIRGVDLREDCDAGLLDELALALREWKLLLFRDQHLDAEQHARFAAHWGELTDDQLVSPPVRRPLDALVVFTRDAQTVGLENEWHSDGTFRRQPAAGTILRAIEVPRTGGDTLFADMAAAYDNLPEPLRARLDGLVAVHDWSLGAYADKYAGKVEELRAALPPVEHPVVTLHPLTKRRTLFVNRLFTREIVGLSPAESDELLDLLCRQAEIPEYQYRFRWRPGSIAFWDNLAVQHYGASDYYPQRRVMARTTFYPRSG